MKKFRKLPVEILAIEWSGENLREIIEFTDGKQEIKTQHELDKWEDYEKLVKNDGLKIYTLEGIMKANVGDFIIKGVTGEHYPCKPDIFKATYEVVQNAP